MRPARFPVSVVLLLSLIISAAMAAGAADTTILAPDDNIWLLLIIIGVIGMIITAWVLVYSFRLVKAFGESISSLTEALRALTPMPVVTLADEIPDGVDGRLEMRITGFESLPLGQVTVILVPPPGFTLDEDHITLPFLNAGETKVLQIGHGPVRKGKYPVGITVLYRIREDERMREITRTVCAGIPAEPESID